MMTHKGHPIFAFFYDGFMKMQERRQFGPIRRKLLDGVTGDIIDVGAGTGANLPYYARGIRVTAVEPDRHMRKRGVRMPSPASVTWTDGSAEDLPFPDRSVDAVVFTLVLCSVNSVEQSLAEAHRVLRAGGQLVFLEHVISDRHHKLQHRLNPLWRRINAGCNLNRDTEAHIKAAGFDIERLERVEITPIVPAIYGRAVKV